MHVVYNGDAAVAVWLWLSNYGGAMSSIWCPQITKKLYLYQHYIKKSRPVEVVRGEGRDIFG